VVELDREEENGLVHKCAVLDSLDFPVFSAPRFALIGWLGPCALAVDW
jgi:hypothetical protein